MQIFWCRTGPWLTRPAVVQAFCAQAGILTEEFLCQEDLVPHAAGRYLLLRGAQQYQPGSRLPPLLQSSSGKPYFSAGRPFFSISHAGKIAVCAFSQEETGIDVEEIVPAGLSLCSFLHPEELAYLQRSPEECRAPVFYQLWTQKESLLKAYGGVLADMLEQESLIAPEGRWKDDIDGFLLRRIAFPDPAYVVSISTKEKGPVTLTCLELPDKIEQLSGLCTSGWENEHFPK